MKNRLIIGTRKSKLALRQAEYVADTLRRRYPDITVELKYIVTKGDKILDVPLAKVGGKGLFTKELEKEILAGTIDLAVHSLKDVPAVLPDGLVLSAVMQRANPADALVSPCYGTLEKLPHGARIGTSSLRRSAQLLHYRPDLSIINLRGNVDTRLKKLDAGEFDALILAVAGLQRLGLADRITQVIPFATCLPAVGQGALALETRADDKAMCQLTAALNDQDTLVTVNAERAFLRHLNGSCQIPVGIHGKLDKNNRLMLEGVIASPDGKVLYREQLQGTTDKNEALGQELASRLLHAGGTKILKDLGLLTSPGQEE